MSVKHLVFSDCTIYFGGVWSAQLAAGKKRFPCSRIKETFSARRCVRLHFFSRKSAPFSCDCHYSTKRPQE